MLNNGSGILLHHAIVQNFDFDILMLILLMDILLSQFSFSKALATVFHGPAEVSEPASSFKHILAQRPTLALSSQHLYRYLRELGSFCSAGVGTLRSPD